MMKTLNQFLMEHPRVEASTAHISNKKLRRWLGEEILKMHESTAKPVLADKILQEISKPQHFSYLFESVNKSLTNIQSFIYDWVEEDVTKACELFTSHKQVSSFESRYVWSLSAKRDPNKKMAGSNPLILLSNIEDKQRVYVMDPQVEVSVVENISPFLLLDKDVKDRAKYKTPRMATFVKLDEMSVLYLFHSYQDGMQKRFILPINKVKGFTFRPIHEGFINEGSTLVPRELQGTECDLDTDGTIKENKRYLGKPPSVWVLDQCHRGRVGASTRRPK